MESSCNQYSLLRRSGRDGSRTQQWKQYDTVDTCFARGVEKVVLRCKLPQIGTTQSGLVFSVGTQVEV
jgi:hypothetical protein